MDVQIIKIKCKRCGYEWVPRKVNVRLCPACKSAYWDEDRSEKNGDN